jgi:hypothetical protein
MKAITDTQAVHTGRIVSVKVGSNRGMPRIWLQDLNRYGWNAGEHVDIAYNRDSIVITRDSSAKRKISAPSKGGVLDLTGNAVFDFVHLNGNPARVTVTITATSIIVKA